MAESSVAHCPPQSQPTEPVSEDAESTGRKRSHAQFADNVEQNDVGVDKDPAIPASSPERDFPALTDPERGDPKTTIHSPETTPLGALVPNELLKVETQIPPGASKDKPAVKRKRLTAEEREARDKQTTEKKKKSEQQAVLRAIEKARIEKEKEARAKEREEKREKKREEQSAIAERKRKKEEEQKRLQEANDKKTRSQMKLTTFLSTPSTPKKTTAESSSKSAIDVQLDSSKAISKSAPSAYHQLFKPFFVRENTRWTTSAMRMDEETREAKFRALEDFISGRQKPDQGWANFDAAQLLGLPRMLPTRGRLHRPVKEIAEAHRESRKLGGTEASNVLAELRKVPMKVISFSQDVRLPYRGTITQKPFSVGKTQMRRQARLSSARRLPLDYDYDSEAEWQEEEGEDIDSDDDEEEQDGEDDLDGFLDDSEDTGPARPVFTNTIEPECSGIYFENPQDLGAHQMLSEYRMEFIHDGSECTQTIDPWSRQLWEPEAAGTGAGSSKKPKESGKMAPPPAPADVPEGHGGTLVKEFKLVKNEILNDVKKMILGHKQLSRSAIVEVVFYGLSSKLSKTEVRNTIDMIAEKKGNGRLKEWNLKPGFEVML